MPRISIITPTYNEAENVELLYRAVKEIFEDLPDYEYEHIFADNCSEDETLSKLKRLAAEDACVKVIANARNFGPTRSVFNAILSAGGDAVVILAADFQDPPELIRVFIEKWREGYQVVFGIRKTRSESRPLTLARRLYYRVLRAVSEDELVNDAGDFVLFDKDVLEVLKNVKSANPYLRGLLSSLGFRHCGVPYDMRERRSGKSGASPLDLFVYAMNGFVNHSLAPVRLATLAGFFCRRPVLRWRWVS